MNPSSLKKASPQKLILNADEIEKLLAMRETHKTLKTRLAIMEEAIDEVEEELVEQLESGADSSLCGYEVTLQLIERRYPSWKEEFISRCGKPEADAVLDSTKPSISKRILIK